MRVCTLYIALYGCQPIMDRFLSIWWLMFRPFKLRLMAAAIGGIALGGFAVAEDARPILHEIPAELARRMQEESVDISYAMVSFPDGGAAIQTSIRIDHPDPRPFDYHILDGTFLTYIDRNGGVTGRAAVQKLESPYTYAVLGLANRHVLMKRTTRGSIILAEIDSNGATVWKNMLGAYTYDDWSPKPISLPNGGFAMVEGNVWGTILSRLDADGKLMWERKIPLPGAPEIFERHSPVAVAADDGDIVTVGDFYNDELGRTESWMFRFDDRGNEIWRRPMQALVDYVVALPDGTMAVFGFPHRVPDFGDPPHVGHDDLALMRFDMGDGSIIRIDWDPLPAPWGSMNCDYCFMAPMALPDSGMMLLVHRLETIGPNQAGTALIRLDADHRLMSMQVASDPPQTSGQFLKMWNMVLLGSRLLVGATRRDPATGTAIDGFYTIPVAGLGVAEP